MDLAIEQNSLEKIMSDMSLIGKTCKENMVLNAVMRNPNINIGSKKGIVRDLFASATDKLTLDFIILLIEKRRIIYLKEIASEFRDLYNKHKGIKVAKIYVARNIESSAKEKIIHLLEKEFSSKIKLIEKIDASVIGGFKIVIDDKIYDASISKQLQLLKKSFEKNLYEKGF
jgi:F-type H+-transporting ATPase subunit delta